MTKHIMKRKEFLVRKIKIYAIISFIIILFSVPIITQQAQNYNQKSTNINYLKYKIFDENKSLMKLKTEMQSLQNTKNIAEYVIKNKNFEGLHLKDFISLISNLKKKYMLSNDFEVSISPIAHYLSVEFNNHYLQYTNLNITCYAYTDSQIIGFIDSLEKNFNGYTNVKYIDIKKILVLDKNILDEAKKDKFSYLVKAIIKIEWYDFKFNPYGKTISEPEWLKSNQIRNHKNAMLLNIPNIPPPLPNNISGVNIDSDWNGSILFNDALEKEYNQYILEYFKN